MSQKQKLQGEVERLNKSYGHKTGELGSAVHHLNVIPTGILSLDYGLGTGGWPLGYIYEIFGPPDVGKSTVLAFNAIKEAQKLDKLCGIVAVEPYFDKDWAIKNGVDPERLIVARPDSGEDAFNILYDWVNNDLLDFIVFDSIGALLRNSELEEGGKPAQGGQSALITWGIKRCLQPCFKNNKAIMLLNQVRDVMGARIALLDSPGGHAVRHSVVVRVQLKPGKNKYTEKIDGADVVVGREIVAVMTRNKLTEGTNYRANFDFYQKETEDHPVGIDKSADVLNTAVKTGVIRKSGAYYYHPLFGEKGVQGKAKFDELIQNDPSIVDTIREEVLEVMLETLQPNLVNPDDLIEENNGETEDK